MREHPTHPVVTRSRELVLRVEYRDGGDADYLTDLDDSGFFLRTSRTLGVGDIIPVTLSFPGLLGPIDVEGVVRWRSVPDERSPDTPLGARVDFAYVDDAERERVHGLIARLDGAGASAPSPFRVLLVEDNDFAHKLFHHAVKRFHYEWRDGGSLQVVGAGDGLDALRLLEQSSFDLAIVDFFLPSLGGAELIRRMRKDPRWARVPVLVISVGGAGVREEALAAGADLYLDKPVLLKQLLTTLHLLIGAPSAPAAALDEAP
jgi:CheY-like chemotaxis protein